ncbi:hypothetical protein ASPZODRAFT_72461 [Penicilliopsis zonata CBS 506.65]|uniref:Very-long-chain (3R)-3-hydroxyacyl-CoA dehydratase n=1 Tax=Penicilliopsis zonata CBS 506.65 TaxID=1073090 RepID=A0A1L9SAB5_9EURO|nr:hypothetical protein ASPZODRAFT_72461 [Penicilliopsis zonata CBS 506.65]OJJ44081.1 hypothetical protein ASPZODRAFT_72461 [Penicilliopsis zonata CBS 506.65]
MAPPPSAPRAVSPLTRYYLLAYNAVSFGLWATCTLRAALLVILLAPTGHLPAVFGQVFSPLLVTAQSMALLEILHSLLGLVRAPVFTTAMQVASRLLLVWGGALRGPGAQAGDLAFLGCLAAWGITECIRYGFFALQVWGQGVPSWWTWLRYNTFYILYPIGISSECILIFLSLDRAAALHPLYWWFFVVALVIYIPGSYILYTHMIAQRRKVLRGKKRA